MECKDCQVKKDLITCFEALKESNDRIDKLMQSKLAMKKELEQEMRKYRMPENYDVVLRADDFAESIVRISDEEKKRSADHCNKLIDKAKREYGGRRVLFIIPLGIVNGGGNVIMNEAAAMRRFGVDAVIMNLESQRELFLKNYGNFGVPVIFVDDFEKAKDICEDFDVVCTTSWQTVFVSNIQAIAEKTKTAYYIQDFEPNFYPDKSSDEYKYALSSYSYVPNMICVTKTDWNAKTVFEETGRKCTVLCPSLKADIFEPSADLCKNKIVVSAMVRPQSMLRSPEATMRILARLYWKYGENVEIHIFGNEEREDVEFFIEEETNFNYINHELTSPHETAEILSKTDVFVDCSKYQAMGLTALEAMASGCAVVLPKNGGTTSFAENEVNCLMVDTLDENACYEAVVRLIEDRELREKLVQNAIVNANDYYPEKSAYLFLNAVFGNGNFTMAADDKLETNNNDFSSIKLIIWDMDDTFWKGTLTEGDVLCSQSNIELIKNLSKHGIINSISSKNDYEPVINKLENLERGLSSYFVFNNINWDEKGLQIKDKLNKMNLRAENVLFIDDNMRNLEEAAYYNNGLMTAGPEVINKLQQYIEHRFENEGGYSDESLKRLGQYQILEQKCNAKELSSSNEQFLYDSDIVIDICFDCMPQIDRIAELVERTNQLNYTKNRCSKAELEKQIASDWNRSAYVSVRDKFGDYGIVGFFCYNRFERKMEHFLFSCRIMGMGVEQYVYSRMGYPHIEIVEPVSVKLDSQNNSPWIHEDTVKTMARQTSGRILDNRPRILLKGPCDLSAIEQYLIGGSITSEFNFVNNNGFVTTGQNHSTHIFEGSALPPEELDKLIYDAPFLVKQDFETLLFKNEYNVICYSLLPDCHAGVYQHKELGLFVSFGSVNFDLTDEANWQGYIDGSIPNHFYPFTEDILKRFKSNWEFVGTTPDDVLLYNLEYMYENAVGSPSFVFILGSETEYEGDNAEFANHAQRHKHVNELIREFASDKPRIKLVNITDYITSQEDFEDSINHFSRRVYYDLATQVVASINNMVRRQ